jgi:hypothetical protein
LHQINASIIIILNILLISQRWFWTDAEHLFSHSEKRYLPKLPSKTKSGNRKKQFFYIHRARYKTIEKSVHAIT